MTKPLFKWPGGKRWLATKIIPLLGDSFDQYVEPFLGGAAFLFAIEPARGIGADINRDLISCYEAIKVDAHRVLTEFVRLKPTKKDYYRIRDQWKPTCELQKAARFIFLMRYSWNGLYRVNQQGHFNVPFSYTQRKDILTEDIICGVQTVLERTTLIGQDFEHTIDATTQGDLIFADPPYFENGRPTFSGYNSVAFREPEQERLAQALIHSETRGVSWILTNGSVEQVQTHFKGYEIFKIPRHSTIAANPQYRRKIWECIVLSKAESLNQLRYSLRIQYETIKV